MTEKSLPRLQSQWAPLQARSGVGSPKAWPGQLPSKTKKKLRNAIDGE